MKNTPMFKRLWMVAIPIVIAAPAWAAIVPCPASPTFLSTIPVTPPNGCNSGFNQFTNFVVTSGTTDTINGVALAATNWPTPPTAGSIDLNALAGGIRLTSFVTCDSNTATPNTFCVQGKNQTLASSITYDLHTTGPLISLMELDGTVISHANTTTAVVFREFCLGLTTFDQTCGGDASKYRVLQVGSVQGNFSTLSQNVSTTFAGVFDVAIRDTVYLQTFNGEGSFAAVTSFDLFTPEPATFGLVGLALAGLGALRFRKRKL
jgi:PEP-CTERM motif-containing protein